MHEPVNPIALLGFSFDLDRLELRDASGARVTLRPQTLAVLGCLARNANRVVTKDELMRAVWPDVIVTDDSLVQCIGELRRALKDDERRAVQTEPRRGYRLAINVADTADPTHVAQARPFGQQIQFASSADGSRIAYATSGDGPPLVRTAQWMTHIDWDWQSSIFGEFIQRLSLHSRLIRYDGRGCGLSDRGVPMATLDDEVHDLEAVVDAAGLDRFALLGRSQGGAIAIRYAARHPSRVSRLVTIGGYARGNLRRGKHSASPESVMAFCKVLEDGWGNVNSAFRQMWTSLAFPGASSEQQDSYNQMQRVACSPQDAAALSRANAAYDASADLGHVKCPTLVLHNSDDALIPFEEGRLIASGISGARLVPFTSRSHQPLPGEPAFDQVMRCIEEFLLDDSTARTHRGAKRTGGPELHVVPAPSHGEVPIGGRQ